MAGEKCTLPFGGKQKNPGSLAESPTIPKQLEY